MQLEICRKSDFLYNFHICTRIVISSYWINLPLFQTWWMSIFFAKSCSDFGVVLGKTRYPSIFSVLQSNLRGMLGKCLLKFLKDQSSPSIWTVQNLNSDLTWISKYLMVYPPRTLYFVTLWQFSSYQIVQLLFWNTWLLLTVKKRCYLF